MWYPPTLLPFREELHREETFRGKAGGGREAGGGGEAGWLLYLNTGPKALCLNLCKEQTFVPLSLKDQLFCSGPP